MEYLIVIIGAVLVNNFVLSRFMGICPFLGVSKRLSTAVGMGMAVTFVMTMASAATWLIDYFLLKPFDLAYLQTITFILVIATLVQVIEMVMQKSFPTLYQALGIFLPLITTNCAVLGVAVLNIQKGYGFAMACIHGFAAALGFTLALVIFSGLRERMELSDIPKPLQGTAITLITAGLLSLAFLGFSGLVPA